MKNKRIILISSSLLSASLFATAITVPIIVGSESVSDVVNNNPVKNVTELNNWFGSVNVAIAVANDIYSTKSKNELDLIATNNYNEIDDFKHLTTIIGVDVQSNIANKPNNIKYKYKIVKNTTPQNKMISSTIFDYTLSVAISALLSGEQTYSNPKTFKITTNIISTLQRELDSYVSSDLKVSVKTDANNSVSNFNNLVLLTSDEWLVLDESYISMLGIEINDDSKKPEDVTLKFKLVKDETEIESNKYLFTIKAETVDGKSSLSTQTVLTASL